MYREMFKVRNLAEEVKAIVGEEQFELFKEWSNESFVFRFIDEFDSEIEEYGKKAEECGDVEAWKNTLQANLDRNCENVIVKAKRFMEVALFPANVKTGMGATVVYWTDREACTVIEVKNNGKTLVLQKDKATLDPSFKPEFVEGGFAGYCINQTQQTYTYEPNPNGQRFIAKWNARRQRYFIGGVNGLKVAYGRSEYYDYNF